MEYLYEGVEPCRWEDIEATIDVGVRDLVKDLSEKGYKTVWSCEGGEGHWVPKGRIILVAGSLSSSDLNEIKTIIRFHTDVPFRILAKKSPWGGPVIEFSFPLRVGYNPRVFKGSEE